MAADTRVSITVDTGNAEGSLSRLGQAFAQAGRAADQASDNIDNVADSATRDAGRLGKALDGMKKNRCSRRFRIRCYRFYAQRCSR